VAFYKLSYVYGDIGHQMRQNNSISIREEELAHRFATGDEEAFTMIYDRFYFLIYQYARRWLHRKEDAEDIVANTFIKLLEHRKKFVSIENIIGFLKITCRNACINSLKHQRMKTEKQIELLRTMSREEIPDFEWAEAQEVFLNLIYSEVEKLPEKMKEIFMLSYRDELKPAEIAKRLHLKVRTVSNQKTNAIHILKLAMAHSSLLLALFCLLD